MKRILSSVVMSFTLAAVLLAQRGPGGPPFGGGQRSDPAASLKSALNLTDAQVEAIKVLIQTERDRAQAIRTEIQQKRQVLDTLLSAASPNPLDVGNAAIALRASESKISAERDWFISELKKLLTGDQQQKLDTILAAGGGRGLPIPGLGGPGLRGGRP